VGRRLVLVYTVSGSMAGLASLIFLARANSASADLGEFLTLQAIAAVLIGGTSLFGGVGHIKSAILGALVIASIDNGLGLLGLGSGEKFVITGGVLLLAVTVDSLSRRAQAQSGRA